MDITDIRRANLRRWIAEHGTPPKEKSLFSQLKSTGSFGEKVARRLEDQYKMGEGFLDVPGAEVADAPEAANLPESMRLTIETARELRLITVYRLANERNRLALDSFIERMQADEG